MIGQTESRKFISPIFWVPRNSSFLQGVVIQDVVALRMRLSGDNNDVHIVFVSSCPLASGRLDSFAIVYRGFLFGEAGSRPTFLPFLEARTLSLLYLPEHHVPARLSSSFSLPLRNTSYIRRDPALMAVPFAY